MVLVGFNRGSYDRKAQRYLLTHQIAGTASLTNTITLSASDLVAGSGGASLGSAIDAETMLAGSGGLDATAPSITSLVELVAYADMLAQTVVTPEVGSINGEGTAIAPPPSISFDVDSYKFESLKIARTIQDVLWSCTGQIDGLVVPTPYLNFEIVDTGPDIVSVEGWGWDVYDQSTVPALLIAADLSGGAYHSMALKNDGSVICWGDDADGQSTVPEDLVAARISAGGWHSIALQNDGTVVCWGYDGDGESTPPDGLVAVAISAGGRHSMALTADGAVICWGLNGDGQCTPPDGLVATKIDGGGCHSMALSEDGTVTCWGWNDDGQCTVPGGLEAVDISAGGRHSMALSEDGTVTCWGLNTSGQCTVPGGLVAVAIAAGGEHSMALTADGTVVAWGLNAMGQTTIPAGLVASMISAGSYHSLADNTTPGDEKTLFWGFVPGNSHIEQVAANKSSVQGYDAGYRLSRQYLPDGDTSYPAEYWTGPAALVTHWLGGTAWRTTTGIKPYLIWDPTSHGHTYVAKDWNFGPTTTIIDAIKEVCEYAGMVFLIKWIEISGELTPCAYLCHEEDLDDATYGLDLPALELFVYPDLYIMDGIKVDQKSDEKYNRIIVRSSAPDGTQYEDIQETADVTSGDELPIEYLEERSDLPQSADHGAWCVARATELYDYYTTYAYSYTLKLIDRVDLELYQTVQFSGYSAIPDSTIMRIIAISYTILPTHPEVQITVTPATTLSSLRKLQRAQESDVVTETQAIAQAVVDEIPEADIGTVSAVDDYEATVALERDDASAVKGRITE